MRDIRQDLKDRIGNIPKRKQELEKEIASLSEEENQLKTLLELEEKRYAGSRSILSTIVADRTLSEVIHEDIIGDGNPRSLEEIKADLKDSVLLAGMTSPGRAIHFALVGLWKKGIAERDQNEKWRLVKGSKKKTG